MKIEIFKNKKSFKKGGFHTNPDICWEFVLIIAFVLVVLSFVFGFYLFRQVNKEFASLSVDTSERPKTVSKERLEKILEYFSEREKKSTDILNSPSPITDPSL